MCGRYAQARNQHELQLAFDLPEIDEAVEAARDARAWPPLEELQPDYNIAPGKPVYAVLGTPPGEVGRGAHPTGPQYLRTLRWGLVPSWAKDVNVGYKMINARSETVAEKPSFRAAFKRRRCLLPADAYYEWQLLPNDQAPGAAEPGTSPATDPGHKRRKAKAKKRPYAVRYTDGSPLALAGLFERWRDPELPEEDPGAWLWTCTVVTTQAAPELEHIHERMPIVVPRDAWDTWLDPAAELADLQHVMAATPVRDFGIQQVGTEVNSVRNNGPELLEPVKDEPESGTLF
ncbi:putative SOS response-associated peptidase YedK [Nocardiopsis mwathae]|uniref:Abasic site processing protein n=1 Tax=Nocardiopsis mwathae TaxID=1472723 RepID=A0A7W9YKJ7_9ACTN|nr:SOS response-associated peptidase [Nocardiopsis mwathae]MBB6173221.1 putative SOS response-associated peptidase YedK [Nocardiopsis mwathae]